MSVRHRIGWGLGKTNNREALLRYVARCRPATHRRERQRQPVDIHVTINSTTAFRFRCVVFGDRRCAVAPGGGRVNLFCWCSSDCVIFAGAERLGGGCVSATAAMLLLLLRAPILALVAGKPRSRQRPPSALSPVPTERYPSIPSDYSSS